MTLSTLEWFSPYGCNVPFLIQLNTFNKRSMKWSTKLKNYEKFLNYHGCELIMMLPVAIAINYYVDGYALVNPQHTMIVPLGISPAVFETSSKYYNFTVGYQPIVFVPAEDYFSTESIKLISINGNLRRSHS